MGVSPQTEHNPYLQEWLKIEDKSIIYKYDTHLQMRVLPQIEHLFADKRV